MIEQFVYDVPTRVLFGHGALGQLGDEQLPGKRALVMISGGGSMRRHGQYDALVAQLDRAGVEHVLFDQVRPNPTNVNVDDAAAMVKSEGCDFVVALGGGSVMDAAKVVCIVANNDGCCWDYAPSSSGGGRRPERPALPLVCVTTSAGTGSEIDDGSVISNDETQEKTGMSTIFPTLSVVDPDLMMSVPPTFTAYQGMDTFFHAAESVINRTEHVVGEMFALKAIELVARYLPRAVADGSDREARYHMAIANTLAGYYMLCTSEHIMEHSLGSNHPELPHGAGLIMLSHEYYDFFAQRKAAEGQMIKMARAMGVDDATSGADFVAALDRLIEAVGCVDLAMSDYGILREELADATRRYHEVRGGNPNGDPVKLTDDDIYGIYERSYR